MTPLDLFLAVAGFILALKVAARIVAWLLALRELRSSGAGAMALASATAANSGPWMLLVVALSAYFVRDEPWLVPIGIGAGIGIAFTAFISFGRPRRVPEWKPGQLIKPDRGLRRILWAGRNKHIYLTLFGLFSGLAFVAWFECMYDWQVPVALDALFFTAGYLVGLMGGLMIWHFMIWPVCAAFPGTLMSPPGERVYEDV
jgi:hypothetical protein